MKHTLALLAAAALVTGCATAGPQTITWDAPTEHTDGSPVIAEDLLYRVWLATDPTTVLQECGTNTFAVLTWGGKYMVAVTAYYAEDGESGLSEGCEVKVRGVPRSPGNVRKKVGG